MLEIGLGIVIFTGIITILILLILVVRLKLVTTGEVNININYKDSIQARTGDKLLKALADKSIYLPSACGGMGTCGQCRVKVLSGGGALLPTETTRITKRDAARGERLACQLVIKQEMAIEIREEIFGAKKWECTVHSNMNVATLMKELVLELPPGEPIEFRAGSYIQVTCPPYQANFSDFDIAPQYHIEWDRLDLWHHRAETKQTETRAYSLANHPAENGIVSLVVRIALPPPGVDENTPPGVVSSYLFGLKPGDKIQISGPYGNFLATETDNEMVFVGGGAGMAPIRSHIFDQLKCLKSKRKISFWYGARNTRELFYADEFDRLQIESDNFQWCVALSDPQTEDDWQGKTGFIHDVLFENYLKDHPAPEECEYYLCGPPMMVKAVCNMLDNLGVDPDHIYYDDFGG